MTDHQIVIDYFLEREWDMGHGQCPECNGVPSSWHGHPMYMEPGKIGHKTDCRLACCLAELGEKVLMQGEFRSSKVFESFTAENGCIGMREVGTVEGVRGT